MKEVGDYTLLDADSGTIDENRLEQYLSLIDEAPTADELLRSFETTACCDVCFETEDIDGKLYRNYYVIGIIGDGDMGATVYVCRPNGSMKTHQLAQYLFEGVRAEDLQVLSELIRQMSFQMILAEGLEEKEL